MTDNKVFCFSQEAGILDHANVTDVFHKKPFL